MSAAVLILGGALVTFVSVEIAPIVPLIGEAYKVNTSQLGLMLGAFLGGFGIFQIPSGFGAIKWGTKEIYLVGLGLMGATTLLSGYSINILELALLRFVTGAGAALSSGSAYSLLSSYYSEGQKGKLIGIFFGITNGAGGIVGLLAGAVLGLAYGWGAPFQLSGGIILVTTILSLVILPANKVNEQHDLSSVVWSQARRVLGSKSIWAISLGLAGFAAGGYIGSDFLAQYFSQVHPLWGIDTAAEILGLGLFFTIPGGIIGGWVGERGYDRRTILALFTFLIGLCYLLLPHLEVLFLWGLYAIAGFLYGVASSVMFMIPAYLEESKSESVTLGIGVINSVQLVFTSGFTILFGIVSVTQGYTFAFTLTGVTAIVLLPILFFLAPNRAVKLGLPTKSEDSKTQHS